MPLTAEPHSSVLPARRPDLIVRPLGEEGRYVVKDPSSGAYYELGEEEHFLLTQLDGTRSVEDISSAFEGRFGQGLFQEELDEFVEMARSQGFIRDDAQEGRAGATGDPRAATSAPLPAT